MESLKRIENFCFGVKKISKVVILVVLFNLLTAAVLNAAVTIWSVYALDKVFQEDTPPASPSTLIQIEGVKGEYESGQFCIRTDTALNNLKVSSCELVHSVSGLIISTMKINRVGYVYLPANSQQLSNPVKSGAGYFPDPLLSDAAVNLQANKTQPYWITVFIPKTAEPGTYNGTINITYSGGSGQMQVTLKVYNYTYPDTQVLKVVEWRWLDRFSDAFPGVPAMENAAIKEKSARMQVAYRHNGTRDGIDAPYTESAFPAFDTSMNYIFSLGFKWGHGWRVGERHNGEWNSLYFDVRIPSGLYKYDDPAVEAYFAGFLPKFQAHLEAKGWLDKYYVSVADEPVASNVSSYIYIVQLIRKYAPKILIMEPMMNNTAANYLDIAVVQFNLLSPNFTYYKDRIEQGKSTWIYVVSNGNYGYPTRLIDVSCLRARYQFWGNLKLGFHNTGYLHWSWAGYYRNDTYQNPYDPGTGNDPYWGNSYIVYPDTATKSFFSSIRLECQRDGIEDYELMARLAQVNQAEAERIVNAVMPGLSSYITNISQFKSYRREMLEGLSGAGNDTTAPSAPSAVRDGTSSASDIDSTNSVIQLSANWDASTDLESAVFYRYAIGTSAGASNMINWTANSGTSVTRTALTLSAGTRYYFSVKAVSAGGESAATNSDGVTVEANANLALGKLVTVSSTESGSNVAANAVDGNTGTRWSSAYSDPQWIYVDLGSTYNVNRVVLNWEVAYGRSYEIQVSANAVDWIQVYTTTSGDGGTDDLSFSAVSGRYVRMYGTQRATSYGYSLWEFEVYGSTATADTTPPSAPGTVRDGTSATDINSTTSRTQLSANWTPSADAQSGIAGYNYAIGTTAGGTNITNWTSLGNVLTATKTGLNLTIGTTYYFSVKAVNGAGLSGSTTNSNGQVVISTVVADTTPPSTPGTVRDGPTAGTDVSFTYSTTTLSANWTASTDNESGITNYQFSIGTSPGATNITNWTTLSNVLMATKTGLSLTVGTTYYFSVKAVNGAGLSGPTTNSNGQYVNTVNTADTTAPSNIAQVRDGNEPGIDANVTYLMDELSANWDNSADSESGISRYYYAIGTLPGATDITNWKDNGALTEVTETGLTLTVGATYYFSVKAENGVSLQSDLTSSDGQLVLLQDSQPSVISNVLAQGITNAGATIMWETDDPSTGQVEYGLTTSYGRLTGEYISLTTAHSVTLTGLLSATQYHYRVISRDYAGNESVSVDYNFTTLATPAEVTEVDAYPNPCDFKNGQVIRFIVGGPARNATHSVAGGEVKIYTMAGKLVRTLTAQSGANEISWDGTNEDGQKVARGIYLSKITDSNSNTVIRNIAVIR